MISLIGKVFHVKVMLSQEKQPSVDFLPTFFTKSFFQPKWGKRKIRSLLWQDGKRERSFFAWC